MWNALVTSQFDARSELESQEIGDAGIVAIACAIAGAFDLHGLCVHFTYNGVGYHQQAALAAAHETFGQGCFAPTPVSLTASPSPYSTS
ncbi:MAG: hypothetical protein MI802_05240, partial [Desulfobacterales bacterium]|nr:hypothetical protein [Desulfobacterales bacterium]